MSNKRELVLTKEELELVHSVLKWYNIATSSNHDKKLMLEKVLHKLRKANY